jgi:hypothetical protein
MSDIPLSLLECTPISKIGDTQIIYKSGQIWNYGTTICESDIALKLYLPNGTLGTIKKIFSNVDTIVSLEDAEFKLNPLHNFVELVFTNLGWTALNGTIVNIPKIIYEEKNLSNYKLDGNSSYLILWCSTEIKILKAHKLLKCISIPGISKCEIRGDTIFILCDKVQSYDITFDKLSFISDASDFNIGNSKHDIILKVGDIWKLYQYQDCNWNYILDTDSNFKIFNIPDIVLNKIQGDTLIEQSITSEIKTLKFPGPILGIWQFGKNIVLLYNLGTQLFVKVNFSGEFKLCENVLSAKVLNYNSSFLILQIDASLKIFKCEDNKYILVFDTVLENTQKFIGEHIYTLTDCALMLKNVIV